MKNVTALFALLLVIGSVSCASAPKTEAPAQAQAEVQQVEAPVIEESAQAPLPEPVLADDSTTSSTTSSELSLGAGSSGRGH